MNRPAKVFYKISWGDAESHLFDIEIQFRASARTAELRLPAWRPGRYLIQNYAANVRQWWAKNAHGKELSVEKIDKSTWSVQTKPGERVTFGYRFFAGVLDAGSSYLSNEEAYFNGTNLFMMVEGQREASASLQIDTPEGWNVETQLVADTKGRYWARDYDYLIDSPVIVSPSVVTHTFDEGGCRVSLVFQNAKGDLTERFVEPVRRIVRAHAELFGGIPTREYRFLYHYADLWHGVEHEDSCSITVKSDEVAGSNPGDDGYDHFLAITSHEFFHLWNVKRILPAKFFPYDYSQEVYTRLLWAMEGITSYFGERAILRSGLWSRERYLKHLAGEIATLESSPGRHFLSLSQASFDGWLQDPAQMHDKGNAWISFYNKGEVVAALLDLEIRRRTAGRRSLDDLMLTLWSRYGKKKRALEEDAIQKAAVSVSGSDFSDFFRRYVDGVEPLPYDVVFGAFGLQLTNEAGEPRGELNATVALRNGRLIVASSVDPELQEGDEIIAINDVRVTTTQGISKAIGTSDICSIVIARNGSVSTVRTHSVPTHPDVWKISETAADPDAIDLRDGWLGSRG